MCIYMLGSCDTLEVSLETSPFLAEFLYLDLSVKFLNNCDLVCNPLAGAQFMVLASCRTNTSPFLSPYKILQVVAFDL